MKVLLLSPPTTTEIKKVLGIANPPLGLAYLASVVRNKGHDVKIIEAVGENKTFEDIRKEIVRYDPDIVGITATTSMIPDAYIVAKIAKRTRPDAIVVIGGPHVTFVPELTLKECPDIDIVVRGEGEQTFAELLDEVKNHNNYERILGIAYRARNGTIRLTPSRPLIENIDSIKKPAFDLINWDTYEFSGVRYATIITSRGCPFQCIFCSSSLHFGKKYRPHSVERVLSEIKILYEKYKIREIEFLDDTFTLNRKRAREIAHEIIKEGFDLSWAVSSRVDTFDKLTGEYMRKAGAHTVYFGLESGTQKILDYVGKRITLQQSREAVRIAKEIGLKTLGSFIIGFPQETKDDIERTISFAKHVGVDYAQFTIATPFPGTRLWHEALKNDLLLTNNWRKYTATTAVMKSYHLSPKQIGRLLRSAYASFYLRFGYVLNDIVKHRGVLLRKAIRSLIA
ncbi:MAG: B12-binding domain-containing radical SAM protein [Candidatus Thorarchaeota archaeon]|nr:MAG: B12-binding domain-containing radical SAM protein [Candidatus Thorarchaeota archaeon]